MDNLTLKFFGPYSFLGEPEINVFSQDDAMHPGIYIWTVQLNNKFLIHYVGMTNKSIGNRLHEHIQKILSGVYSIHDPNRMLQGELNTIWSGLGWGKESWKRAGEFLNNCDDLLPKAMNELKIYKLYYLIYKIYLQIYTLYPQ